MDLLINGIQEYDNFIQIYSSIDQINLLEITNMHNSLKIKLVDLSDFTINNFKINVLPNIRCIFPSGLKKFVVHLYVHINVDYLYELFSNLPNSINWLEVQVSSSIKFNEIILENLLENRITRKYDGDLNNIMYKHFFLPELNKYKESNEYYEDFFDKK